VKQEIEAMLQAHAYRPGNGLFGEPIVKVLEMNLELTKRYGTPF
jgi:K+-transporting ATPase c subunit